MAVAKKISEFGVCAFPLVTVLGRFPLGQRTGKAGSVRARSWLVVLSRSSTIISSRHPRRRCPPRDFPRCELMKKDSKRFLFYILVISRSKSLLPEYSSKLLFQEIPNILLNGSLGCPAAVYPSPSSLESCPASSEAMITRTELSRRAAHDGYFFFESETRPRR